MPRLEASPRVAPQRSTPWYRAPQMARYRQRLPASVDTVLARSEDLWERLSPVQQILVAGGAIFLLLITILFLAFHSRILAALAPFVAAWRDSKAGWLVIWIGVIIVGFPPLIGFATCVTLAGFVFGTWRGYLIVATATTVGATLSFLACRHIFRGYIDRKIGGDKRFEALALVLKHDGLKLLIMIRLCPLPYSFSNGAFSAIPTITPLQFMLANAIATPKLLVGCFIGSKLGQLAQDGGEMDLKTKLISWISIGVGVCIGIGTGWFMYTQTQKRARELEELERQGTAGTQPSRGSRPTNEDLEAGLTSEDEDEDYLDEVPDHTAADQARGDDGMSMHTTKGERFADDDDHEHGDEWADDGGDASNLEDVFQAGEDSDESDPSSPVKYSDRKGKGW